MNILLLNPILHTPNKGVIPRRQSNFDCMIYNMARGFVANGHKVTVIASEEYKPLAPEQNGFEVLYFPSVLPKIFKPALIPLPRGLYTFLKNNRDRYDLVITSETFALVSLIARFALPQRLMIWQELNLHQKLFYHLPSKIWHNLVARPLMSQIPVVGRSDRARDFIRKYMKRVSDNIVDHGANSSVFQPTDEKSVPEKRFIVISQLIERKRIDYIITRFAEFVATPGYGDYRLEIIGKGPQKDQLQKLIDSLGMNGNITLRGFMSHDNLAPLSAKSVGMLVYTEQDLNMVTIPESIVNGTPVLMNSVPCTAPFVQRNLLGIVNDNWGAQQLIEMVDNYPEFHRNCLNIRPTLTENGCAARLVEIWTNEFRPAVK